jgi:hypothetical protein
MVENYLSQVPPQSHESHLVGTYDLTTKIPLHKCVQGVRPPIVKGLKCRLKAWVGSIKLPTPTSALTLKSTPIVKLVLTTFVERILNPPKGQQLCLNVNDCGKLFGCLSHNPNLTTRLFWSSSEEFSWL